MSKMPAKHRDTDTEATSTKKSSSRLQGLRADELVAEASDILIQGYYKRAGEKYQNALELAESIGDNFRLAEALNGIGNSQENQGLYTASLGSFERLLDLAEQGRGSDQLRSAAYSGIGLAYKGLGEYRKAIGYHEKQLAISQKLGDGPSQGRAYGSLGVCFNEVGKYRKAIEYHEKDLTIAQELGDRRGQGRAYGNLGNACKNVGEFEKAIEYHDKNLAIAQDLSDSPGQGRAYNGLGNVYNRIGEYKKAIEYHEKHLAIAQELGDRRGQGRAYGNLGVCFNDVGQYRKAIEYHRKRLAIAQELGNRPGQGRAYGNLGNAYNRVGEYRKAIQYHEEHLAITQELGDKPGQGRAYGSLGSAYNRIGEHRKAIEYHKKHLVISQELGDAPGQGVAYGNLGVCYRAVGEYKEAIEYHKKHLAIAQKLGDRPGQGAAYGSLGNAYRDANEYRKAIVYHKKRLVIAQELGDRLGQGRAYSGLGNAYSSLGMYKEAIKYHEKHLAIAQELGDMPGQGRAYGNLGNAYGNMGKYSEAIECHKKDLAIAHELGDTSGQVIAHSNIGLTHWDRSNYKSALTHFREFGQLLHSLERQLKEGDWRKYILGFLDQYSSGMDGWVMAAAQEGEMAEALRVEEWRRCRSELAYLSEMGSGASVQRKDLSDEMDPEGLAQIVRNIGASYVIVLKLCVSGLLTWVLSSWTGELVYSRLHKLENLSEIAPLLYSVSFAEWDAWRQGFDKARRVFEYPSGPEQRHEAIKKGLCEICFPDYLKDTIPERLWEGVRNPIKMSKLLWNPSFELKLQIYFLKKAEKALGRWNELIWDPIIQNCEALRDRVESDTAVDRPIYFLGDSIFSMIPFGAFKVGDNFLIEKVNIAQASSLHTLDVASARWRLIRKEKQSSSQALVVSYGDPVADDFIIEGSKELSRLFGTPALSGDEATKDGVIERICRDHPCLLHVLAHGTGVDKSEWAGIQLAQDTVLTAAELNRVFTDSIESRLVLPTRLMTLCCCSSGLGVRMGEGVQGFARAALAGGCPCLLAPKWDIPAKESLHLMREFYRELAANEDKPQTVTQALRNAVVALRKNEKLKFSKSFYYWAAFVPHGYADVQLDDRTMKSIRAFFKDYECPEGSKSSDEGTASTSGVDEALSAWDCDDVEKMWDEWNEEYSNAKPDSRLVSRILGRHLL